MRALSDQFPTLRVKKYFHGFRSPRMGNLLYLPCLDHAGTNDWEPLFISEDIFVCLNLYALRIEVEDRFDGDSQAHYWHLSRGTQFVDIEYDMSVTLYLTIQSGLTKTHSLFPELPNPSSKKKKTGLIFWWKRHAPEKSRT
jgi:hypothetical protein